MNADRAIAEWLRYMMGPRINADFSTLLRAAPVVRRVPRRLGVLGSIVRVVHRLLTSGGPAMHALKR
jgi:hypothetical protein